MRDLRTVDDLRALPRGTVAVDRKTIVMPRAVLEAIPNYTDSRPTGTPPGKIYRRDESPKRRERDHEPLWYVYIIDVALDRQGKPVVGRRGRMVDHHCRRVEIVE